MARYVSIQREWLRQCVDAMGSVFKIQADEITVKDSSETDSIVQSYKTAFSRQDEELSQLVICGRNCSPTDSTDDSSRLPSDSDSVLSLALTTTNTTVEDELVSPRRILRSKRSMPRNWSFNHKITIPRIPHRQSSLFDLSSYASKLRSAS
jgi:hypothetical protein